MTVYSSSWHGATRRLAATLTVRTRRAASPRPASGSRREFVSIQVFGLPVSRGVAIGRAVLVASSRVDVAHYYVEASMIDAEVRRLGAARDLVVQELTALKGDVPEDAHDELVALLDVHLMLLQDDTLSEATRQWIVERHYNAELARDHFQLRRQRPFGVVEDEYL